MLKKSYTKFCEHNHNRISWSLWSVVTVDKIKNRIQGCTSFRTVNIFQHMQRLWDWEIWFYHLPISSWSANTQEHGSLLHPHETIPYCNLDKIKLFLSCFIFCAEMNRSVQKSDTSMAQLVHGCLTAHNAFIESCSEKQPFVDLTDTVMIRPSDRLSKSLIIGGSCNHKPSG